MRPINRYSLPPHALAYLDQLAAKTTRRGAKRVEALWRSKSRAVFDEVKLHLRQMAPGRERCMYCEDSAGTDIEHFWPKSLFPMMAFDWENYLWACSGCNSNQKRTQFPLHNGSPLLLDPTNPDDNPLDHLVLVPDTGDFVAKTQRGRQTIKVFGLQRPILITGRAHAWHVLERLILNYAVLRAKGHFSQAEFVLTVIRDHSFSTVLFFMLSMCGEPNVMPLDVSSALKTYVEIADCLNG